MDQKTWLWRKKSSEKAIVTTDKINSSLKGNEEEVIQLLFCSLIISLLLILLQNWIIDILHNGSLFKFIALWVPQFRVLIKPIGSLHWHVNMLKSRALAIKCLSFILSSYNNEDVVPGLFVGQMYSWFRKEFNHWNLKFS